MEKSVVKGECRVKTKSDRLFEIWPPQGRLNFRRSWFELLWTESNSGWHMLPLSFYHHSSRVSRLSRIVWNVCYEIWKGKEKILSETTSEALVQIDWSHMIDGHCCGKEERLFKVGSIGRILLVVKILVVKSRTMVILGFMCIVSRTLSYIWYV